MIWCIIIKWRWVNFFFVLVYCCFNFNGNRNDIWWLKIFEVYLMKRVLWIRKDVFGRFVMGWEGEINLKIILFIIIYYR